jgi:Ca2+-binding EF-hand superfamily protein
MYRLQRDSKNFLKEKEEREKVNRTFYLFQDQLEALQDTGAPSRKLREALDHYLQPGNGDIPLSVVKEVLEHLHYHAESQEIKDAIHTVEESLYSSSPKVKPNDG